MQIHLGNIHSKNAYYESKNLYRLISLMFQNDISRIFTHISQKALAVMTSLRNKDPTTGRAMEPCTTAFRCNRNLSYSTIYRKSTAVFGLKPKVIVSLQYDLEGLLPSMATPKYLLWGLSFLKLYEIEESRASKFRVDKKACWK